MTEDDKKEENSTPSAYCDLCGWKFENEDQDAVHDVFLLHLDEVHGLAIMPYNGPQPGEPGFEEYIQGNSEPCEHHSKPKKDKEKGH